MIDWYIRSIGKIKSIREKAIKIIRFYDEGDTEAIKHIVEYAQKDYKELIVILKERINEIPPNNLGRHLHFAERQDFVEIIQYDIPPIEDLVEVQLSQSFKCNQRFGFEELLDEDIARVSLGPYSIGHYRDSVLNAFIAVFDLIRQRTKIDLDGSRLATRVFSVGNPLLILSDIATESGKNDQAGFMGILQGVYQGIRNPKAHSLQHDLDEMKTAQYLIFASLLLRRVRDAKVNFEYVPGGG